MELEKKAFPALPASVNTGFVEEHMKSARMHMYPQFKVSCQTCDSETSYSSFSILRVVERIDYPHVHTTFLVSTLPGYWKYVRS